MSAPDPIVLSWEEWKASRAAKRAALAAHGLDKPSRRKSAIGSQEARLRKAFEGKRAPALGCVSRHALPQQTLPVTRSFEDV